MYHVTPNTSLDALEIACICERACRAGRSIPFIVAYECDQLRRELRAMRQLWRAGCSDPALVEGVNRAANEVRFRLRRLRKLQTRFASWRTPVCVPEKWRL